MSKSCCESIENGNVFPKEPIMTVFKGIHIDAGHYLNSTELSEEENKKIFGKCNAVHGHRFNILVEIEGPVRGPSYMVIELRTLKERMLQIVSTVDHFSAQDALNLSTDETRKHRVPATGEHFCAWFYEQLKPHVKELNPSAHVKSIKIQLSEEHGVQYYPPKE